MDRASVVNATVFAVDDVAAQGVPLAPSLAIAITEGPKMGNTYALPGPARGPEMTKMNWRANEKMTGERREGRNRATTSWRGKKGIGITKSVAQLVYRNACGREGHRNNDANTRAYLLSGQGWRVETSEQFQVVAQP